MKTKHIVLAGGAGLPVIGWLIFGWGGDNKSTQAAPPVPVVSGQVSTLFTTPVVYLYLDRFGAWLRGERADDAPPEARRAGPVRLKRTPKQTAA